VDQLSENAIIGPKGIGRIEPPSVRPAQRAAAFFIQRETVEERRSAAHTKVIGRQGSRNPQARAADWDAGRFVERFAADAALIGENHSKEGGREIGYPAAKPSR
jgi:hypothetical protein